MDVELTFKGQDLELPSEAAHAPWLAVAHSPSSWQSHVKIQIYPLLPSKLSFLNFYLFGFCCSHFTSSPRFSLFQCVAGR